MYFSTKVTSWCKHQKLSLIFIHVVFLWYVEIFPVVDVLGKMSVRPFFFFIMYLLNFCLQLLHFEFWKRYRFQLAIVSFFCFIRGRVEIRRRVNASRAVLLLLPRLKRLQMFICSLTTSTSTITPPTKHKDIRRGRMKTNPMLSFSTFWQPRWSTIHFQTQ